MTKIKIGSVPEHFNLPWHLSIENKNFEKENITVEWTEFPEGTGAMTKALRTGTIDIAILLTEGIVKDITDGNPSKIVQTYIETPLIWGIHVDAKSKYQKITDLKNTSGAISRYGSGSHLMAYVNAKNQGWNTQNLQFEVIKNLDGAIKGLANGKGDYFMWEHFTTKPLVDNGTFRRIGDCPTPWPCFVIAVRNEVLESKPEIIQKVLKTINKASANFKQLDGIDEILATRYEQKLEDIKQWLSMTEWGQKQLPTETLEKIQNQLISLDIIDKKLDPKDILFSF